MIILPVDASDQQILATARSFVDRLAENNYEEAWRMIDP
jgi:hypothetical protein